MHWSYTATKRISFHGKTKWQLLSADDFCADLFHLIFDDFSSKAGVFEGRGGNPFFELFQEVHAENVISVASVRNGDGN